MGGAAIDAGIWRSDILVVTSGLRSIGETSTALWNPQPASVLIEVKCHRRYLLRIEAGPPPGALHRASRRAGRRGVDPDQAAPLPVARNWIWRHDEASEIAIACAPG